MQMGDEPWEAVRCIATYLPTQTSPPFREAKELLHVLQLKDVGAIERYRPSDVLDGSSYAALADAHYLICTALWL
jgi:hypothetical protein